MINVEIDTHDIPLVWGIEAISNLSAESDRVVGSSFSWFGKFCEDSSMASGKTKQVYQWSSVLETAKRMLFPYQPRNVIVPDFLGRAVDMGVQYGPEDTTERRSSLDEVLRGLCDYTNRSLLQRMDSAQLRNSRLLDILAGKPRRFGASNAPTKFVL